MVSYLRRKETISANLKSLISRLETENMIDKVYIFSDFLQSELLSGWSNIVDSGETKYRRIKKILPIAGTILLSVDNDTAVDIESSIRFVKKFIASDASIGWGRIGVSNTGFIPDMISIDKRLSHSFIRPTLWNFNIGISIPGQFFILRTDDYIDSLPEADTSLDDLQIGLITHCRGYSVFQDHNILARENAKTSLKSLLQQRKRWALGYAAVLHTAKDLSWKHFFLVIVHGMSYHIIFPTLWFFLISFTSYRNFYLGVLGQVAIIFLLANFRMKHLCGSILYYLLFPAIHLFWFLCFILYWLNPEKFTVENT